MKDKEKLTSSRRVAKKYFCSIEVAIGCINGKWKPATMHYLNSGPKRFTELCKLLPKASKKVLAEQLRELEADGMIIREELNDEIPKGTKYSLTAEAKELLPVLQLFHEWGVKQAHRKNIPLKIIVSAEKQ